MQSEETREVLSESGGTKLTKITTTTPAGWASGMKAKMGVSGFLQFRDKDGNILKEVEIKGAVPMGEKDGANDSR